MYPAISQHHFFDSDPTLGNTGWSCSLHDTVSAKYLYKLLFDQSSNEHLIRPWVSTRIHIPSEVFKFRPPGDWENMADKIFL